MNKAELFHSELVRKAEKALASAISGDVWECRKAAYDLTDILSEASRWKREQYEEVVSMTKKATPPLPKEQIDMFFRAKIRPLK
jgi:hypothetical protein